MKVFELMNILCKCQTDAEVYFEETSQQIEDGIKLGTISKVNDVYEIGVRAGDEYPWKVQRVLLSN